MIIKKIVNHGFRKIRQITFTKELKLPKDLSAIVGKKEACRSEITKGLWTYWKKNDLQDPMPHEAEEDEQIPDSNAFQ